MQRQLTAPATCSVEDLKRGVAAMSTRPFGELFAEGIVGSLYGLKRVGGQHDLSDGTLRYEVKFSRIYEPVRGDRLLDQVVNAGQKRFGSKRAPFAANFQKLHPAESDVIFYGIVFDEGIDLYRAPVATISFSNQHLHHPVMKQFGVAHRTVGGHSKNLVNELSWERVLEVVAAL